MDTASRLANLIERTISGPMWHGPSLTEVLDGVSPTEAAARPIGGAHTIWELVLHITTWADVGRARLTGQRLGGITEAEDWPTPGAATADNWSKALGAMRASYTELASETRVLTDDALRAIIPQSEPPHSVETLLHGVVEHGCYHGGQIALLKRAVQ